jgi:hypothetical protein
LWANFGKDIGQILLSLWANIIYRLKLSIFGFQFLLILKYFIYFYKKNNNIKIFYKKQRDITNQRWNKNVLFCKYFLLKFAGKSF